MTEPSSQLDVDHCTAKPMPSGKSPPPASADAKGAIEPGCADVTARTPRATGALPTNVSCCVSFLSGAAAASPVRASVDLGALHWRPRRPVGLQTGKLRIPSPRRQSHHHSGSRMCRARRARYPPVPRLFLGRSLAVPWQRSVHSAHNGVHRSPRYLP